MSTVWIVLTIMFLLLALFDNMRESDTVEDTILSPVTTKRGYVAVSLLFALMAYTNFLKSVYTNTVVDWSIVNDSVMLFVIIAYAIANNRLKKQNKTTTSKYWTRLVIAIFVFLMHITSFLASALHHFVEAMGVQ